MVRRFRSWLSAVVKWRSNDRLLDDELRSCLEILTAEKIEQGVPPPEARRQAALELGGVEGVKTSVRDVRPGAHVHSWLWDIRYAARGMRRKPTYAAAVVLCLAAGAAANTTLVSVADALLYRPLPVESPGSVFLVGLRTPKGSVRPWSLREYETLRTSCSSCAGLSARTFQPVVLRAEATPVAAQAEMVSGDYFHTLGVRIVRGRALTVEDERSSRIAAVMSDHTWTRVFDRDPDIVGTTVHVNGVTVDVVGIAPDGFDGVMRTIAVDLWLPFTRLSEIAHERPATMMEDRPWFGVVARLADGATAAVVQEQITAAAAAQPTLEGAGAVVSKASGVGLPPGFASLATQGTLFIGGLVAVILGVCVANVASLAIAQQAERAPEFRVRAGVGASRYQLVRQLAAEIGLLALIATAVGIPLAYGFTALIQLEPAGAGELRSLVDVQPDMRVLAYSVLAGAIVGVICGIGPALYSTRRDARLGFGAVSRNVSRGTSRLLRGLVAVQVAVSVVPLLSSMVMYRSVISLERVDIGVDVRQLTSYSLDIAILGVEKGEWNRVWQQVADRAGSLPGVRRAAVSREGLMQAGQQVPARRLDARADAEAKSVDVFGVSDDYFDVLGLHMLAGRSFGQHDAEGRPPVAIVGHAVARELFGSAAGAIGRSLDLANHDTVEIVGVVADRKVNLVGRNDVQAVYRPLRQEPVGRARLLVRHDGQDAGLTLRIADEMTAVLPDLVPSSIMDALQEKRRLPSSLRGTASLLFWLCVACLVVSMIGVFGLVRYVANGRTREIGIRLALGSSRTKVMWLVAKGTMVAVGTGAVAGSLLAALGVRGISHLIYGIGPIDAMSVVTSAIVVSACTGLVATVATLGAATLDPIEALRAE